MNEFFAIISGENIELGRAELRALLPLVCDKYNVRWYDHLAIIKADSNPVGFILDRAALIKEAGSVILDIHSSSDIITNLSDDAIESIVEPSETFCIRTRLYAHQKNSQYREQLVGNLGAKIGTRTGAKVSMNNPDVTILVILTTERTFVCKSLKSELRGLLRERKPGRKEFFHPSMMSAQLARVMCNLAKIMPDEIVFDPFCGGGGILCEAAILGAKVVGWDLNWRLIMGATKNLAESLDREASVIQADSRYPPLQANRVDCITTDPPYGRTSSTRGAKARGLALMFLEHTPEIIKEGGRL